MLGLYATVGRSIFPVESWEQVSAAYRAAIAQTGLGSAAPRCLIIDEHGTVQYHCTPRGLIWRGNRYTPGAAPIYVPH